MHQRAITVGFVFALLVAGASFAADATSPLVGNTLTVTEEGGDPVVLKFNADGTYSRNDAMGTWEEKDGAICMTPEAGGETYCEPLEAGHAPGETWQQQSADGGTVTMTLTAGQ